MPQFAVTGISHKFTPVEVRELLAFQGETLPRALRELREQHGIAQAVILSTCNRVEIVTWSDHPNVHQEVVRFLSDFHRVSPETFSSHIYSHSGAEAVDHVLRVAASLDSLVLGETQILAQIKDAYSVAAAEGATGKALNALMHRAFSVAKEVHSQTALSRGRLSVASVAVDLIRRTFEDLQRRTVLLIGLGEMGELTLRHLRDAGVGNVIIANRTHQRAIDMAQSWNGEAIPLSLLDDYLHRADIVVSQTASPGFIVTPDLISKAMRRRAYRPMFLVDLAVPRDIHPEADRIDGVYRYEVDDLQRVVAEASEARAAEVARAVELIEAARDDFLASQRMVPVEPILLAARNRAEDLLSAELGRVDGMLSPEAAEIAREVCRRFMNKLLHPTVSTLKEEARNGADLRQLELAARLLGVSASTPPAPRRSGVAPSGLPALPAAENGKPAISQPTAGGAEK